MYLLLMLIGLLFLIVQHSSRIIAPEWREAQVAKLGENRWKLVYSALSLVALVLLIFGFARARLTAPVLYTTPFGFVHLTVLLMFFSFVCLMVSLLPAGRLKPMLKHPLLAATKIWAFAHLLVNGDLASVLLFGPLLAWAVWMRIALKRRGDPTPARGPAINDVYAVIGGTALWLLFIWKVHEWLIGGPVPIALS